MKPVFEILASAEKIPYSDAGIPMLRKAFEEAWARLTPEQQYVLANPSAEKLAAFEQALWRSIQRSEIAEREANAIEEKL